MKSLVVLLGLAISACTPAEPDPASDDVEDQRKYVFPPGRDVLAELEATSDLDGFKLLAHGTFDYADVYLDTDGLAVLDAGLSVRFRRVVTDSTTTYKLQVKSEKVEADDVRLEVDFDELADDPVTVDGTTKTMEVWLDPVFEQGRAGGVDVTSEAYVQGAGAIRAWMGSIGREAPPVTTLEELIGDATHELRPIVLGGSLRTRFHVYSDGLPSSNPVLDDVAPSEVSGETLAEDAPFFLQAGNESFVWLIEASYDQSTFYPAEPPVDAVDRSQGSEDGVMRLEQLETENKYRPLEQGTVFMDAFEAAVRARLEGTPVVDSKYVNAIDELFPKL